MNKDEFCETKKYLLSARGLVREIEEISERIQRLDAMLTNGTSLTAIERVSASHGNAEENKRIEYSELINAINAQKMNLTTILKEISKIIMLIDNSIYRRLLCAYYIDCMTWEKVAEFIGVSDRHLRRIYPAAICAFAQAKKKAEGG